MGGDEDEDEDVDEGDGSILLDLYATELLLLACIA
jgi:hypothetical protein